ncbi:MAG TPA: tetratricopeptide repeat protein [Gemmatimonadaceae bacterium]|jgi:tetratricopeptide (TPR) repeat protein
MSKIASLKKKAADLEKKSPDKAIAVYVELLAEMEKFPEDMDVALFNRAGDLMVKQGNTADAVDYYEKAVDYYAEGGFFNNAIALCNKILRTSPGRASVYYKLGRISAEKGFKADAKQNFLEYADRMQKGGKIDEAFRALAEFADLCPDQTDIRLMLADQLAKAGKKDEAVEQLQILHEQLDSEGNTSEAQATAERLKALDPSVEPRMAGEGGERTSGKSGDLVFLDLGDTPKKRRSSIAMKRATLGLKVIELGDEPPKTKPTPARTSTAQTAPPKAAEPPPAPPPAPTKAPPAPAPEPPRASGSLLGLESTSLGDTGDAAGGGAIEIESTSLLDAPGGLDSGGTLDFVMPDGAEVGPSTGNAEVPLMEDSLIVPDASETLSAEAAAVSDLSLLDDPMGEISLEEVSVPQQPLPSIARPSTLIAEKSVEMLQAVVEGDPEDWASRRELAEAMLEAGNREAGVRELEVAMSGYERSGDLATAMSVADEIVRVDPSSVKHHQKRVEYAYRTNDRPQLVEAYLALADALFRGGQVDKSRTIYQRVLELSPDDLRAQAALSAMPEPTPEPPPPDKKTPGAKRAPTPAAPAKSERKLTPVADDSFVNLGDWLRDDESPKDTRMVVAEEEPTGNEEADFADMLKKFKAGVAENVDAEDYQSHYDLGVAYKEMGLVDEAISEFQKALRGPEKRVRTYEAIGQCFIEKGNYQMAATILARGLNEKGMDDDQLVGVLYLLGRANEALGKGDEAMQYYQRVFVVDITFQDVADRLSALENATR